MRTVIVVVTLELVQHGCSLPLVDDQKTVEQFAANGANEAFRDCVRSRRAYRCPDDLDVDRGEYGIMNRPGVSGDLRV